MDFSLTEQEQLFEDEVKSFLKEKVTEEAIRENESGQGFGPASWALLRDLGQKRWLVPWLPFELGGMNSSHIQRLILSNQLEYHRVLYFIQGASIVAPCLWHFGSDELQKEFLPLISTGQIECAIGYTEADAGSDLAALKARADEKRDYYLINGSKMFTTAMHYAQYVLLAARTAWGVPKHRGISLFIVNAKSPGITLNEQITMDGHRTNEVFYDNVRVDKKYLIGEENRGFYHLLKNLDWERLFPIGGVCRIFDDILEYAKEPGPSGKASLDDPGVGRWLAEMAIEKEIVTLFGHRVAWMLDQGMPIDKEAAMLKVFQYEFMYRLTDGLLKTMDLYGQLSEGCKWAPLKGRASRLNQIAIRRQISGGTSEIQRNTIVRALGLPRD